MFAGLFAVKIKEFDMTQNTFNGRRVLGEICDDLWPPKFEIQGAVTSGKEGFNAN